MTVLMIYLIKRKKPALQIKITPKQSFSFSEINTVVELRDHILNYAIKNWQAPKDISLNFIGAYLANNNFSYDLETYVELCKKLMQQFMQPQTYLYSCYYQSGKLLRFQYKISLKHRKKPALIM